MLIRVLDSLLKCRLTNVPLIVRVRIVRSIVSIYLGYTYFFKFFSIDSRDEKIIQKFHTIPLKNPQPLHAITGISTENSFIDINTLFMDR